MAVVQSTYAKGYESGFPGQIANGETSNRISRTVEDAAGVAFGKPVFRGTGDHGVTATPSANLVGITIANYAAPANADGVQADLYVQNSTAGILTQGVIWVVAGEAVTAGAAAYATAAGAIVDTATGNTALTGWVFDHAAASGALVRLAKR
jgi:hypothetical protein